MVGICIIYLFSFFLLSNFLVSDKFVRNMAGFFFFHSDYLCASIGRVRSQVLCFLIYTYKFLQSLCMCVISVYSDFLWFFSSFSFLKLPSGLNKCLMFSFIPLTDLKVKNFISIPLVVYFKILTCITQQKRKWIVIFTLLLNITKSLECLNSNSSLSICCCFPVFYFSLKDYLLLLLVFKLPLFIIIIFYNFYTYVVSICLNLDTSFQVSLLMVLSCILLLLAEHLEILWARLCLKMALI